MLAESLTAPRPLVAMADDDDLQAELVSGWLQALGYAVMSFPDGDSLMDWASSRSASNAPAAVLLDVEMPGTDGFTVCRRLRGMTLFADVPVACVSSIDACTLARGAMEAGADASLRKDVELLPRLAAWLPPA